MQSTDWWRDRRRTVKAGVRAAPVSPHRQDHVGAPSFVDLPQLRRSLRISWPTPGEQSRSQAADALPYRLFNDGDGALVEVGRHLQTGWRTLVRQRCPLIAKGGRLHRCSPCLEAGGVPSRILASLPFRRVQPGLKCGRRTEVGEIRCSPPSRATAQPRQPAPAFNSAALPASSRRPVHVMLPPHLSGECNGRA